MQKIKGLMLVTLALALVMAFIAPYPARAQEDNPEEVCFQKGSFFGLQDETCVIEWGLNIRIEYPLELAQQEFTEQIIDAFLAERRLAFVNDYLEYGMEFGLPWSLDISYEILNIDVSALSFCFDIYEYTGGAHGNMYFQTFIFDLMDERVLELADLFNAGVDPLAVIAPLAAAQLNATEFADADWIAQGTAPISENYQHFGLNEGDLVIYFPPYQVAAYAAGPQEVRIPLTDLQDVLNPMYLMP